MIIENAIKNAIGEIHKSKKDSYLQNDLDKKNYPLEFVDNFVSVADIVIKMQKYLIDNFKDKNK